MTTEPQPAVRTMIEAANNGDLAGFLAGFTDDGAIIDGGREFRGVARRV
jgi:hypothetical protein